MSQLTNELTSGPLAAELAPLIAAGNDQAIYDVLWRSDIAALGVIGTNEFVIWAASTGQRAAIEDVAANPADALRPVALALQDLVRGNLQQGLDFGNPATVAMADAWLAAGKMTGPQHESLMALAMITISRAEQSGINPTITDIRAELWNPDGSSKL